MTNPTQRPLARPFRQLCAALILGLAAAASGAMAQTAPLKLVGQIAVPGAGGGEFDHLMVDVPSHRLFAADEGHKTVEVSDISTNRHIITLGAGLIHTPHSLFYRQDLQRLYVVDGDRTMGAVRIYDGKSYALIKSIDLPNLADWGGYDPATKLLYVSSMGAIVKKPDSVVSVIDTTTGTVAGQFTLDDSVITAFAIDPSSPYIYTGYRTKNVIAVIDRTTRKVVATWPFKLGTGSGSEALDPVGHRLFVNCRSGQMLVFDTTTGVELQAIAINTYSDDISWDAQAKRLYVTAKGDPKGGKATIQVIQQIDPDHYRSLGEVGTEPGTRTGTLVPALHRFFAGAPKDGDKSQHVLVYAVS